MNRRLWLWCVIGLLAAGAGARAAESLRIVPIVGNDKVLVSFELADAFTDEVREAISSGLRTTFTYQIELRMIVPIWVDPKICTAGRQRHRPVRQPDEASQSRAHGRRPHRGDVSRRRRIAREALVDDVEPAASVRHLEAGLEPRLLRARQRARAAPRRLPARLGQHRDWPGEVHLHSLGACPRTMNTLLVGWLRRQETLKFMSSARAKRPTRSPWGIPRTGS